MKHSCNHKSGLFLISLLSILLVQCSSSDNEPAADDPGNTNDPVTARSYDAIGLVTDIDNKPVNFAKISGGSATEPLISSSEGVFIGETGPLAGDWIQVSATGYVDNYVQSRGVVNGSEIITVQLTPLGAWNQHEQGTTSNLAHQDISIHIPANLFATDQVTVSVTQVSPSKAGARVALTTSGQYLKYERMFAIEAKDLSGDAVTFSSGVTLPVTIEYAENVAQVPDLYYFDTATYRWDSIDNACVISDTRQVTCDLPHLSLFALDADTPSQPLPYPSPQHLDEAEENIDHANAILAEANATGSDTTAATSLLNAAVALYTELARQYANSNFNEDGKMKLMQAIAYNNAVAQSDAGLESQALSLTELIAQDYVIGSPCGKTEEIKSLLAQLETLNSTSDIKSDLENKLDVAKTACNVWEGQVNVFYDLLPVWSSEFLLIDHVNWFERHTIELRLDANATSTSNISLSGTDQVYVFMPHIRYQKLQSSSCGPITADFQLYASPPASLNNLSITGFYSEGSSPFTILTVTGTVNELLYDQNSMAYIDNCVPFPVNTLRIPYSTGYGSTMSFPGSSPLQAYTLQDLLNWPVRFSTDRYEQVQGISFYPVSINSAIPWSVVFQVRVEWEFIHRKITE